MNDLHSSVALERQSGISEWIVSQRIVVIILTVMLAFGAGAGIERLKFSSDYRDFFSQDNPKLLAFEALQDKFVRTNNVYIALESSAGDIFTGRGLELVSKLTSKLWELPYVIRVDSVANYQFLNATADEIQVTDLQTSGDEINDEYASSFQKKALLDKELNGYLVVKSPALTGINISLSDAGTTEKGKVEFMSALDSLLADSIPENINTYLTGSVVIDHGFDMAAEQDVENLYAIVYLLILGLTWLLTRSLAAVVGVLLLVTVSWLVALGVAGWYGVKLTAISVSAPTVLMTLAVAQSMHVIFAIQKKRSQDIDIKTAVQHAVESNAAPLFLVSLSTAVGFLTIMTSEVPPLQDLGFILAIGIGTIFLLVLTFLPAFLSYFSLQKKTYILNSERSLAKLGYFISRHVWKITTAGIVVSLVMLVPIKNNEINDNFIEYFDVDNTVRQDAEYINSHLTGIHHIYFELESNGKGGIFNKDYLNHLNHLVDWLEMQPEIRHVSAYTDVLKRLNRASFGDDPDEYRIPDNSNIASQLHLLYEMSLPLGLTTSNFVDIYQKSTRLSLVLDNLSSAEMMALEKRIIEWHKRNRSQFTLHAGTGPSMMFADIGQRNAENLIKSTLLAMIIVSVILFVALRNIKFSLVSLLPNLLPPLLAFGIWGLVDGEVGLAISIVVVMTFGIIVDDTIFILLRFKQNMHHSTFSECLAQTYRQVGKPIINTTIILTLGFLVLALSNFRLNQGMGMLTALVIFLALVYDLFVLPGVLRKIVFQQGEDRS